MAIKRSILTEEQVNDLRRRFDVPVKLVAVRTPEQMAEKREKSRAAYQAKSSSDLDVRIARHESWITQLHDKYGVSLEWYEAKLAEQRGLCAICHRPERCKCNRGDGAVRRLAVDHNHLTNEARGLLCHFSNTRLGAVENRAWRTKAEAYLASHGQVVPT